MEVVPKLHGKDKNDAKPSCTMENYFNQKLLNMKSWVFWLFSIEKQGYKKHPICTTTSVEYFKYLEYVTHNFGWNGMFFWTD